MSAANRPKYTRCSALTGAVLLPMAMLENPWVIQNPDQLKAFAASFAKTDYSGKYIVLGADIDLAGEAWTPIGHLANGTQAFRGSFDGQGHKISNMAIGSKTAPVSAV